MFNLLKEIPNEGPPCRISEVCFHPNGDLFGVTYQQKNEVRLYETHSMSLVKVFRNPSALLNKPHGLLITQKHVIVSNKGAYPSSFQIYRLDDESDTPVHTYTTPYSHLAEGHSIALNGRRLAVSYCEGVGKKGAVVSYDFDDESGKITGPIDIREAWFRRNGDAKGLSFDEVGQTVFLTFQSDMLSALGTIRAAVLNAISFGYFGRTLRNGIVAFGIDQEGRFTRRPLWSKIFPEFCRLENIHLCAGRAVVTNADAGCVYVYDSREAIYLAAPSQVLSGDLAFPHGAKFSPDGTLLVISDNGIEVVDHIVSWGRYASPRKDRLLVFNLERLGKL
jgi:hypothetical protein